MQFMRFARIVGTISLLSVGMTVSLHAQQALEPVIQKGHSKQISCVSISSNGALLATCGRDFTAMLWDVATGTKLREFVGHRAGVWTVSISHDGQQLLTGSEDHTAIIWDTLTGEKRHILKGHDDVVRHCEFSSDGKSSLTSDGRKAILWASSSGEILQSKDVNSPVTISEDGKRIATRRFSDSSSAYAVNDRMYYDSDREGPYLRTFGPKSIVMKFEKHSHPIAPGWMSGIDSVSLTPDGRFVATAGGRSAIVYDVESKSRRRTIESGIAPVTDLDLLGPLLAIGTASPQQTASVWDLAVGKRTRAVAGVSVALSRDGTTLFTTSRSRDPSDWEDRIPTAVLNRWLIESGTKRAINTRHESPRFVFSNDRTPLFLASGTLELKLDVFDPAQQTLTPSRSVGGSDVSSTIALSHDGASLVTMGLHGSKAQLWTTANMKAVRETSLPSFSENSGVIALSPDSRLLVTDYKGGIYEGNREVRASPAGAANEVVHVLVWDIFAQKPIHRLDGHTSLISTARFLSDGKRFITGGTDGLLILWETQTGRLIKSFRGHSDSISKIAFGDKETQMWTASADGTTRLWDVASGKELCKLMTFKENDWLVVTPEGLFDGSVDGPRYLAYRISGTLEFVPLERYQQKFYQPGLLASLTRGTRLTPKVDITKSIPPKVRITSPALAAELKQSSVDVRVEAETRGEHPIKSLRLLLDGRPFGGQNGIHKIAEPKLGLVSAAWNIELDPGRHTLKVLADTEYVQGASEELEVRYVGGDTGTPSDLASVELPSLYVLSIGISKYPGTRKLDYAAADADAIAKSFDQYSRGLFKNLEVKAILDEQADRKGFFSGMQWLREKMTQKSVGVVFFAGHGEKDKDGTLYFLPVDFEENNLAGSAIDADVLKRQLMGVPGRLTLMLDACHSGEIGKGKTRGVGGLTDQLIRDLTAEENGLVMMCSALGNELAQESNEHRHGLFTVALLEGLKGQAEKTKDGAVYLTSLDAYVTKRVRELSKGQQNPVTGKPTSVRDFPMSRP